MSSDLADARAYLRRLRAWLVQPAHEQCESLRLMRDYDWQGAAPMAARLDVVWRQFNDGSLLLHLMPDHGHPLRELMERDGIEELWRRTCLWRERGAAEHGFLAPEPAALRALLGRPRSAARVREDRLLAATAWAVNCKLDAVEAAMPLRHRAQLRLVVSSCSYLDIVDGFDLHAEGDPSSGDAALQELSRRLGLSECFLVTTAARLRDPVLTLVHLLALRAREPVEGRPDEARIAQVLETWLVRLPQAVEA